MTQATSKDDAAIIIKKYANRRLYNTATSCYVTLEDLAKLVKEGQNFAVVDAKSGEDLTRSVLAQIIFEAENKGQHLLPEGFLRRIIGLYGDNLESLVPGYLEMSMEHFFKEQEKMREMMQQTMSGLPSMRLFEDLTRNNMALFQGAMAMFNPATAMQSQTADQDADAEPSPANQKPDTAPAKGRQKSELDALRSQMAQIQKRLDSMASDE